LAFNYNYLKLILMAKHFSGEEKLRIVLESIIRGISKDEQCKKYECSETDFDAWREHLVTNGGKVFEPGYGIVAKKSIHPSSGGWFSKFVLSFSILVNIAFVSAVLAWQMKWIDLGSYLPKSQVASTAEPSSPSMSGTGVKGVETLESLSLMTKSSTAKQSTLSSSGASSRTDSSPMPVVSVPIPSSTKAPMYSGLAGRPRPTFEIDAFGVRTLGRQIVFALDASDYMTRGSRVGQFRELKEKLRLAISRLSEKNHFNLLVFRNLREIEMFGKTILLANSTNKSLALKWLKEIGEPYEKKQAASIRRPNDRDIMDKPPPGTVGPWYALYCAIKNYEPDAVFVLTGECSSMRPQDFSSVDSTKSDLRKTGDPDDLFKWELRTKTLRRTAVKWLLVSMKADEMPPTTQDELELLALARLQMTLPPKPQVSSSASWPWRDVYQKFRDALNHGESDLPIVHFVVALPEGVTWPADLSDTAGEFARMAKGQLMFTNATPP
tara:strand:+ start:1609 stop:3093 length:1485 start_codon:yes stop_codon:yes gene_type:complete